MKKLTALALICFMLITLIACTADDAQADSSKSSAESYEHISKPDESLIDESKNGEENGMADVSNKAQIYSFDNLSGEYDNTVVLTDTLTLAADQSQGSFTSQQLASGSFTMLCSFYNCTLNGGTVELSVAYETAQGWSEFYSFGVFSEEASGSKSASKSDETAKMDIDTLFPKNPAVGSIKLKLTLKAAENGSSPVVYSLGFTADSSPAKKNVSEKDKAEIAVPKKSQMNIPGIGNSICSPTSTAMVLEFYNIPTDQAVFAYEARDYGADIFGNWLFNIVAASNKGVSAYIDFYDIESMKYALSCGVPVICSIMTKDKAELTGSAMAYPSGHLVCVTGYKTINGVDYLTVNDPAVYAPEEVYREYRADEFVKAWRNGVVYIIQPRTNDR